MSSASTRSVTPALVIGAIGIVFGDVGTSLLYALRAVMQTGLNPLLLSDVLGVLSLIFLGNRPCGWPEVRRDRAACGQRRRRRCTRPDAARASASPLQHRRPALGDGPRRLRAVFWRWGHHPRDLGAECRGGSGTTSALVRASDRSSVRARHHLDAVPDHPDAGYRLRLYLCARWG